jgi:hypothetical protein
MSLIDDAIGKAEALVQALKDAKTAVDAAALEQQQLSDQKRPPELAVAPPDAEQVQTAELGHDNTLPFKCPACGKVFTEQVTCDNGHVAIATLPTAEVLAGIEAPPSGDQAPAAVESTQAVVEETTTTPEPPPGQKTPPAPDPSWPGGTA